MINDIQTIVKNDYCVGCGACGVIDNEIKFELNQSKGLRLPKLDNKEYLKANSICPFTNKNQGFSYFKKYKQPLEFDPLTGFYKEIIISSIKDSKQRAASTSGGLTSYILKKLIKKNLITGVLHLAQNKSSSNLDDLFEYKISRSITEIDEARGTKYYPGNLKDIKKLINSDKEKLAIVGLPCFIRSIRLLCEKDEKLKNNIRYAISLVCGHMKSINYSKYLAYHAKVKPQDLVQDIDYREPIEEGSAHEYRARFKLDDNKSLETIPIKNIYAENWSYGACMPKACSFCDDVAGENADITIGDAWIPPFDIDSRGTNIAIIRNNEITKLLDSQELNIIKSNVSEFVYSQAGSYRNRREGIIYRQSLSSKQFPYTRVKEIKINNNFEHQEYKIRSKIHSTLRGSEKFLTSISHTGFILFLLRSSFYINLYKLKKNGLIKFLIPSLIKEFVKSKMPEVKTTRKPYKSNHKLE